jgi:Lar family restriction alleviation protein
MDDLLPCPFCGETATFTAQCRDRRWGASVNCENCGASGGGYYNAANPAMADEPALAAWNRRPTPTAQEET